MDRPYLNDKDFLKEFDTIKLKEKYVKIILLDWQENEIQEITGQAVGGSINIDGSSTVRRNANINFILNSGETDLTNINNILSINKKVSLEIGIKNTTNRYKNYPIIWYPMGVFIVAAASTTQSTSGIQASTTLKDKMCLLNGEIGGTLPASVNFNEIEYRDENGEIAVDYPTVFSIIQELVHHWGNEELSKILIYDIDTRIKKVMKWTGSTPLYMYKNGSSYNLTTNESTAAAAQSYTTFESGRDVGYIYTDFYYSAGDLVGDTGSSITSILDKIKSYLGNYEYFYDVHGNFIFREIKNYLNTSQTKVVLNNLDSSSYLIDQSQGKTEYDFLDGELIVSYNYNPQYSMIKNDYVVWGIRKTASGVEVPIRYHLAIDKKPQVGKSYNIFFYKDGDDDITKAKSAIVLSSSESLPKVGYKDVFYIKNDVIYEWSFIENKYVETDLTQETIRTADWREELYLDGVISEPHGLNTNYYFTELKNELPKQYDFKQKQFTENPQDLDFFLDFIDSDSTIGQFSIENIGRRSKVVTDNSINCIFEPEIPNWILLNTNDENIVEKRQEAIRKGEQFIQMDNNIYSSLAAGGSYNSAYNYIRELLYENTSYNNNINIQCIPIFHLEPNTRIKIRNKELNINGDYMIKSMQIPLDASGTMSISAIQALDRI